MRFDQQTECIHPTDVSENMWKSRNSRSGMLSTKIGLDMRNQSKKGLAQCESHRNLRPQTFTLCEKSPVRHTIMKWKKKHIENDCSPMVLASCPPFRNNQKPRTLWCHQTWRAGKSPNWMEILMGTSLINMGCPLVIKHGWKIPELNGGLNRKSTYKWSIFHHTMFDDTGG